MDDDVYPERPPEDQLAAFRGPPIRELHKFTVVDALRLLYEQTSGSAEFDCTLGLILELASAFRPYESFTPEKLRELVRRIFEAIPDATTALGWTWRKEILLTVRSRFGEGMTKWRELTSGLGASGASWEIEEYNLHIFWPLPEL